MEVIIIGIVLYLLSKRTPEVKNPTKTKIISPPPVKGKLPVKNLDKYKKTYIVS